MSDPFDRDDRFGPPKPPVPFEMPGAPPHIERRDRGVGAAVTIPIGAAVVFALFFILFEQDPNKRREATAVIPVASAPAPSAPRRGAIAQSVARKKLVFVNDFATDAQAEAAARETCGQPDCVLVETFAASCVAKAVGKGDRQEIVYGHATREEAEKAALAKCGKGCSVQTASCPDAR